MIQALSDGGRCGVIVPEGLLFGANKSHKEVRRLLLEKCDLHAIVSFPDGAFKPYSGVKTSALIFAKGKPTKKVWFYEIATDGFSLDDNRRPTPDKNDIPDLIAKWPAREVSERSWIATIEQIRATDFNLTAGRYKPVTTETANHDRPAERFFTMCCKLEAENHPAGQSSPRRQTGGQKMKRWPQQSLEQIAEVVGGSTPSRNNSAFWGGDIHWVTPTDLPMPDEGISVVNRTRDRITQAGLKNSAAKVVPKGTVLFSSRATIGKVAVAGMPLATNQGFANFIPHPEIASSIPRLLALESSRGDISATFLGFYHL